MDIQAFVRGLVIGFSIAAPVGPIGILCIRRTVANGKASGLLSGLGAATADAFYGVLAVLGLSFLTAFLVNQQDWLRLLGGLFLCYLGIRTFFDKPAAVERNLAGGTPVQNQSGRYFRARLYDYASTFFLTLTNPLTILSFTAIFAGIGLARPDDTLFSRLLVVVGVFLGSTFWWFLLTSLAGLFRERFLTIHNLLWINRLSGLIITGFGLFALAVSLPVLGGGDAPPVPGSQLVSGSALIDPGEYPRVEGPLPLQFPEDHGAHPQYLTEWWYFTGNLASQQGRRFGYQLTFFRRALAPPDQTVQRPSEWAASQAYMAHFAITDVQAGVHHEFEQLSRAAAGLAGSQLQPFRVWLYGWQVEQLPDGTYALAARENDISLQLELDDLKGPVLHGNQGYSQKGAQAGQASIYYSLTRLASQGALEISGQKYDVSGLSWMDHEFSTSALSDDQVGWDWFSFQLENGVEVMLFQIRKQDGSLDPFSSGTLVYQDGTTAHLARDDFSIQVLGEWKSPHSSALYPSGWRLRIAPALELTVRPCLADQELTLSYVYWEGCVDVSGTHDGLAVSGRGYVELTGYAGSMGGEF